MNRGSIWALSSLVALALVIVAVLFASFGAARSPLDAREAEPSPDLALRVYASDVLGALATGDTARLSGLLLTEAQHNKEVWPQLPAARPEIAFPVDEAWSNIQRRNRRAVARLLPYFRGRHPILRSAHCGGLQELQSFRVRTDCAVEFGLEDGTAYRAVLFKDLVERDGTLRAFRYYDEPVRRLSSP